MKILIYSPLALENGRGGEISAIELAAGLSMYYSVQLIDSNRMISKKILSKEVIEKKLKGLDKTKNIKYLTLNVFKRNFSIPRPRQILSLLKEIKKSDIIYTSMFNVTNVILFIFFSFLQRNAKFIIGFRKPLSSSRIFSLYNIKYRFSILLFTIIRKRFYIHTISKHAKIYLENFISPERINHIIHGVEIEDFKLDENAEKSHDILKFIYVGYLDDIHKGLDILIKAINNLLEKEEKLPLFFEFCGAGPLENKIQELEIKFPEYVKYHGYVDNVNILNFYRRSDVLLFTSRREPFGRVLIEAMVGGLLIICSKTIGSIEILKGEDFAFFLQDLSIKEINDKILKVFNLWIKQRDYFRKLQESSILCAQKSYSFGFEIDMFRTLIENLKDK